MSPLEKDNSTSSIKFKNQFIQNIYIYVCAQQIRRICEVLYVDKWSIYLQWKSGLRSLSMSFYSDIVIVVLLDLCVVLGLPYRGNRVANMQLLCQYTIDRNCKGSQSTDIYIISSMQIINLQALFWLVKIFNVQHRQQYETSSGVFTVLYFIFRYKDLLVGILILRKYIL